MNWYQNLHEHGTNIIPDPPKLKHLAIKRYICYCTKQIKVIKPYFQLYLDVKIQNLMYRHVHLVY